MLSAYGPRWHHHRQAGARRELLGRPNLRCHGLESHATCRSAESPLRLLDDESVSRGGDAITKRLQVAARDHATDSSCPKIGKPSSGPRRGSVRKKQSVKFDDPKRTNRQYTWGCLRSDVGGGGRTRELISVDKFAKPKCWWADELAVCICMSSA